MIDSMYVYNLGQKFKFSVRNNSNKVAIVFNEKNSITFLELEILSNRVANFLIGQGVKKGDVVAIQNNKTATGFAAMIACLKLGIIYTNFDYTNPKERISRIFEVANPKLVLADTRNEEIFDLCQIISIPYIDMGNVEVYDNILKQEDSINEDLLKQVSDGTPVYIMFTSGSTGIPKGVLIRQRSLLNFIEWGKETYQLNETDIMTNINPIYFDNSVFDFFISIFNGISMVAISKDTLDDPVKMVRIIDENQCTVWFSVPSVLIYLNNLKLLNKSVLKSIRIFVFGGEGYPKELLRKLYNIYAETAELYNVYGPTEGTCICSSYKITPNDIEQDGLAPLGNIASNFDYYILDDKNKEAYYGELCLMGTQLAIGYYNDIERTNKSFVKCPIRNDYFELMYRTGDIVEKIDGKLYFKGRIDNQIKHMGYRIELEEIENALIKVKEIKQCAVVHTISKNKFSRLVAYIAADQVLEISYLRIQLKKYLPYYMIPSDFKFMSELPKNVNGKIDRVLLEQNML